MTTDNAHHAETTIVLVTCTTWPELSTSDALFADELKRRGCTVHALPWNGAPLEDIASADAIVMRSNWDYHHEYARFINWLDAIESTGCVAHNSIDLIRSTLDKGRYLTRLAAKGIRVARTLPVHLVEGASNDRHDGPGASIPEPAAITAWADDHGFDRLVVKPAYGASGHEVDLVDRAGLESVCRRRAVQALARPFLVQEFLPQVADGESSVVFFGGRFSHAFRRTPAPTDFRVNGGHGGTTTAETGLSAEVIDFAADALTTLPVIPTFARVDVVGADTGDLALMELEINEPALGMHIAPAAARLFADEVLARTQSAS